jgi:hydroxymethylpyrimidine/phosphomethylpyrimidine kinase
MFLHKALTIAGSDSGGGAGIQADLKTFTALGVYGASAITALTAQNTVGVHGIHTVPGEFVRAQLMAILDDIDPDVAKSGMLANSEIIEVVASAIEGTGLRLVVDPVMVSKHGQRLLEVEAESALIQRLLPLSYLVTPNTAEAEVITGHEVRNVKQMEKAARAIHKLGARNVLVKGGHLTTSEVTDVFFDGEEVYLFSDTRLQTSNTHGTGCTLSAAITAYLARGEDLHSAIMKARSYLRIAMERGLPVGQGISPVNHLWPVIDQHPSAEYPAVS